MFFYSFSHFEYITKQHKNNINDRNNWDGAVESMKTTFKSLVWPAVKNAPTIPTSSPRGVLLTVQTMRKRFRVVANFTDASTILKRGLCPAVLLIGATVSESSPKTTKCSTLGVMKSRRLELERPYSPQPQRQRIKRVGYHRERQDPTRSNLAPRRGCF